MENSEISWTHHTFNPWWGCVKVSPGCANCYAETLSKRFDHNIWGPAKVTDRRLFSDKHWNEPLKWNRKAKQAGERHRVFCASMADVFEDHSQVLEARVRLLDLIVQTPHLDWLLLTKRPENINRMIEEATGFSESSMWFHAVGNHVWIGTSVESQATADLRIPYLLQVPADVRFLSMEPLLGPVDLRHIHYENLVEIDALHGTCGVIRPHLGSYEKVHWVIVGGESGPGARPMHPEWAMSLRDQCQDAGVAFHFKQWGEWYPDNKRIFDVPMMHFGNMMVHKMGKKRAGRELDGRVWDEFPKVSQHA